MFDRLDEKSHSWPFVAPQATPRNSQAASISRMDIGNTIFTEKSIKTFPTKLNTRPHSSEDVNGNIDDLGPVKPLGTASCSRSSVFLLFSRDYHSGLLSVTSCLIESNSEKLSMLSPDLGPANCRSAPSKIHRGRVGHGGVAVESPPPESAWREQGVAIDRRSVPRWTRNPTPLRSPRSSGGPHSSAARRLCSTASDAAVSIMVNRNARTAGLGVPARAFPDASPRGD